MNNFRFVIPLAGAMAAAMMLSACMDESPWGSTSKETGTIDITLTADYSFDTSKPVFSRAEDDGSSAKDLSDYTTLPELDDFMITLVKKGEDDSTPVFKNTYADFKTFIGESKELGIGQYTITASYGDAAEQGFDKVYLEDSYTFSVLPNHTTEISLNPELKKSMVQVAYTQDFKDYMKSYTAKLTSGSSLIEFAGDNMDRAAFINPDEASIVVEFTTKHTDKSANVKIGTFAPVAKTLHLITFDISENENGFASISVNLDDSLTDEELTVDITEDLYSTPAPVVTPTGFESGVTYDMATRESSDGKQLSGVAMTVEARGGIKEAVLKVEGDADEKINLYNVSEESLNTLGIVAKGFYRQDGTSCMASLNLDAFVQNLTSQSGVYTISLNITDSNSQTCDPVSVTLNSKPVTVTESVNDDGSSVNAPVAYGANTATVSIDFNGSDPTAVVFMTPYGEATYDNNAVEVVPLTRAFDTNRCTYPLTLPGSSSLHEKVEIKAYYNDPVNPIAVIPIPVIVPSYSISDVDAFTTYAYLKVIPTNPSELRTIMENIKVRLNSTEYVIKDTNKTLEGGYGLITITDLSTSEKVGTEYEVSSSITGGDKWNDAHFNDNTASFTTEAKLRIPNGDFSSVIENGLKSSSDKTLNIGGTWYRLKKLNGDPNRIFQHISSFERDLPNDWSTINQLTAWEKSSNYNTWYVVPSSWVEGGEAVMRNVGYNHNGRNLNLTGSSGSTIYYCTDTPSEDELKKVAGEIFLGSYSVDDEGNGAKSEGISFTSRPSKITFDYEYSLGELEKEEKADQGYAYVEILDSSNKTIGSNKYHIDISVGTGTETIDFVYGKFGAKAAAIRVSFKSSNKSTDCISDISNKDVPIHIPKGTELNEGASTTDYDKTVDANMYKAVATGSILKIDNVTAHYDSAPAAASAPKRNYTKKRK